MVLASPVAGVTTRCSFTSGLLASLQGHRSATWCQALAPLHDPLNPRVSMILCNRTLVSGASPPYNLEQGWPSLVGSRGDTPIFSSWKLVTWSEKCPWHPGRVAVPLESGRNGPPLLRVQSEVIHSIWSVCQPREACHFVGSSPPSSKPMSSKSICLSATLPPHHHITGNHQGVESVYKYPGNGILSSYKKEQGTDTDYSMDEP